MLLSKAAAGQVHVLLVEYRACQEDVPAGGDAVWIVEDTVGFIALIPGRGAHRPELVLPEMRQDIQVVQVVVDDVEILCCA